MCVLWLFQLIKVQIRGDLALDVSAAPADSTLSALPAQAATPVLTVPRLTVQPSLPQHTPQAPLALLEISNKTIMFPSTPSGETSGLEEAQTFLSSTSGFECYSSMLLAIWAALKQWFRSLIMWKRFQIFRLMWFSVILCRQHTMFCVSVGDLYSVFLLQRPSWRCRMAKWKCGGTCHHLLLHMSRCFFFLQFLSSVNSSRISGFNLLVYFFSFFI